jgi:hypothetical protein
MELFGNNAKPIRPKREAGSSKERICSLNMLTLFTPTTCNMNTNVNEKNEILFVSLKHVRNGTFINQSWEGGGGIYNTFF